VPQILNRMEYAFKVRMKQMILNWKTT